MLLAAVIISRNRPNKVEREFKFVPLDCEAVALVVDPTERHARETRFTIARAASKIRVIITISASNRLMRPVVELISVSKARSAWNTERFSGGQKLSEWKKKEGKRVGKRKSEKKE